MSVRRVIQDQEGLYYITITCSRWLPLFKQLNAYQTVYNWFDYLKGKGHYIVAYVIMPNHLHALIGFKNTGGDSINSIIGNGKRFISYDLVKQIKSTGNETLLEKIASFVNETDRLKGKLHEVFEPSFDWKKCISAKFVDQKLDYIHYNPCRPGLVCDPVNYLHSSAKYYYCGEQGIYNVTSYMVLLEIDSVGKMHENDAGC